jgi:hypothetical protein
MRLSLRLLFSIIWVFLAVSIGVFAERPFNSQARLIDSHGLRIPSIFYGTLPNPKAAFEHSRIMKTSGASSRLCNVRDAVYRESDGLGRLLRVSNGCRDVHYQVEYYRSCGSQCGGGYENWTYSDSLYATWCDQYSIDLNGCVGGCAEESYCDGCL